MNQLPHFETRPFSQGDLIRLINANFDFNSFALSGKLAARYNKQKIFKSRVTKYYFNTASNIGIDP